MNQQNHNQYDGNLEEKGLDPFLEELLGNVSPPNLHDRIQQRLRDFDPASPRAEEMRLAVLAAEKDVTRGLNSFVIAPPVQRDVRRRSSDTNGMWRVFGVCAALAASVMLAAFFTRSWWISNNTNDGLAGKPAPVFPQLGEAHKTQSNTDDGSNSRADGNTQIVANDAATNDTENANTNAVGNVQSNAAVVSNSTTSGSEKVANNDGNDSAATAMENAVSNPANRIASGGKPTESGVSVDSNGNRDAVVVTPGAIANSNELKKPARKDALPHDQIVSVIDRQMEHMWSTIGIKPERTVAEAELVNRITLAIVGRLPTSAEIESLKSIESKKLFPTLVDRLVSSDEYAKHWAPLLAQHYLGFALPSQRDQTPAQIAFVGWVENSLKQGVSIGELERQLFASRTESAIASETTTDSSKYWLIAAMERGESAQRDSSAPTRAGMKPLEPKEAAVVALARHAMRLSSKSEMICSQCHTASPTNSDTVAANANQESFWNTVASFSNVGTQWINDAKSIVIGKPNPFYFEDEQGKLTLATASLPNGDRLVLNNASLDSIGAWFKESNEPRKAVVNVVWSELFEQPLVPVFGLVDGEGDRDRVDLCDMLAVQLNAHDGDLKALLKWAVLSKPFRLERSITDSPWYLRSSNSQIASVAQRRRVFASFSRSTVPNLDSSSRLVDVSTLSKWFEKRDGSLMSNKTLAQPSISTVDPSKANSNRKSNGVMNEYSENQVRFLISTKAPYEHVSLMATKMSDSNMEWSTIVEHVYLLSEARMPTRREVDDASRILELTEQDKSVAFTMLLNAQLGCP